MVAGGIVATGIDTLLSEFSWARIGMLLVVCGAVVTAYAKLKARTEENSETYRLGYDLGFEAGYRERDKTARRPVLVDLDAHRSPALNG
jgi:hypothetical protein